MKKLTRAEFIESNQYLRKGFKNLSDEDLNLFKYVAENPKIDLNKDINLKLMFKQVLYHMTSGMNLREMRGFLKALNTLSKMKE